MAKRRKDNPAYELGFKCFVKGALDNPYKFGSYMYKEWQRGFDTAYIKHLRKENELCKQI